MKIKKVNQIHNTNLKKINKKKKIRKKINIKRNMIKKRKKIDIKVSKN